MDKELEKEVLDIWQGIKTGQAKNHHYKFRMVNLYNKENRTRYKTTTNCGSCLQSMYTWMKEMVEKIEVKPKKRRKKKNEKS